MSMVTIPAGTPDVITGKLVSWAPPENCPVCGSHYQAGPERGAWMQDWHCWKCGYVRGQDQVAIAKGQLDYNQVQQLVRIAIDEAMNSPAQKAAAAFIDRYGVEGVQKLMDADAARLAGTATPTSITGVPQA